MERQRTIASEVATSGVGLHTGNTAEIRFKPAPEDSGIQFKRIDLSGEPLIKATIESTLSVARSPRRTTIVNNDAQVHTIEHLMAALAGLGIDNITVEINNNEVPGLDGSGMRYVELLMQAGVHEQRKPREYCVVSEPVFIEEDGASIIVLPADDLKISYTLNYNQSALKTQFLQMQITPETFLKEIAPARTFCLEEEADTLKRQGFGKGATYENTLVIGKDGVVKNTLRFPDEFIRHKMLDLLGDLYLAGRQLRGHVIAVRSGHALNLEIVKRIVSQSPVQSTKALIQDGQELDVETIMKILPHREPFLFVDRILSLEKGKRAKGIKNVTINDYFFKGHFPGKPVMPGVIIVEAMAQVGGVMMLAPEENQGKIAYFIGAENVRFRKPVVPGDQLVMEVEAVKIKPRAGKVRAKAFVDGKVVAEADFMFALAD
ncbi:MAG: bifunctional UDP-3-O-[3-hydroxymyristoyl] N-acetylglucosamine deacetylase/3-hydroxyacyl-ACP dehydratase [Candidatus Omnitrophica bacterium]|nr:bifunctional UDP-3-O-[3-hydroxymyristoyl] N-acetylglucosamine deacetylase/3-hydroxyacyl-ACP dehydratase [Candidatus Omnitrophota bacterium]